MNTTVPDRAGTATACEPSAGRPIGHGDDGAGRIAAAAESPSLAAVVARANEQAPHV